MRHRFALLLVLALGGFGAATAGPAQHVAVARAASAKTCKAGYTHAKLSWGEKCLKVGQFCKRTGDREYRRYGFRCTRRDSTGRYHLTRR